MDLESNMRNYKDEIDNQSLRNNDLKRNNDFLAEKIAKLEIERRNLSGDMDSLKQNLESKNDESDALRSKLNDAANKFEQTFTKQEGA